MAIIRNFAVKINLVKIKFDQFLKEDVWRQMLFLINADEII